MYSGERRGGILKIALPASSQLHNYLLLTKKRFKVFFQKNVAAS